MRNVGAGIFCYVCSSGEQYEGERCHHIPEDGVGYEDLKKNCSSLSKDWGWPERDYTLCRKYIQDGKLNLNSCNSSA